MITIAFKWTEELIKERILKCKRVLDIERMPTNKEVIEFYGNTKLSNKISKTYGYEGWAKRLGLQISDCETKKGRKYEKYICEKLRSKGYKALQTTVRYPYDIIVNDNIKIDVKVASPYQDKKSKTKWHTFALHKIPPTCDLYICITLSDKEEIERIFIIPSAILHIQTLSVGKDSIYNKYIGRWDYIKKYDDFRKLVKEA